MEEDSQNEQANLENTSLCKYCKQGINTGSIVCHHCGKDQRLFIGTIQFIISSTALVMVVIAGFQTYLAYTQLQDTKRKEEAADKALVQIGSIQKQMLGILADTKASREKIKDQEKLIQAAIQKISLGLCESACNNDPPTAIIGVQN